MRAYIKRYTQSVKIKPTKKKKDVGLLKATVGFFKIFEVWYAAWSMELGVKKLVKLNNSTI